MKKPVPAHSPHSPHTRVSILEAAAAFFFRPRLAATAACVAALCLLPACQNVPKYKRASGKWDEWSGYEGKAFSPSTGTVAAVDLTANTITIAQSKGPRVFSVTPATRIMHEGTEIALAQLPLNQQIKFLLAANHKDLVTVWYGRYEEGMHGPGAARRR